MSSVLKKIIPKEAYDYSSYNGFLYIYTLIKDVISPTNPKVTLKKGMWYLGAHGSDKPYIDCNVDDGYAESCQNEDFRLLYCGTEPVFELEIFYLCKNWTEAKLEENRMLVEKSKDIINGMSFNNIKTLNLINKNESLDREPCKELIKEVKRREKNKWGISYQDKKKYTKANYEFLQVKDKDDKTHKKDVKNLINDAKGVVNLNKNPNIDPVLVFEKRGEGGRDLVVNGNVTAGAIKSKDCKAQSVPEIRIPYEENIKYNEKQYRYIGLTLNRRGKKVTRTTNVDAATRYVQDHLATDGATYNTKYNKTWIREDWDLSYDQVNQVMQNVKDNLFKKEQDEKNKVLPDYTSEQIDTRCDELRRIFPNDIIFSASVGMLDKLPMRILDKVDKDIIEAKTSIPERKPRTKVRMVMNWNQSKSNRDKFLNIVDGDWITLKRKWDNINSDITISYEEMELTVDDKKGATEIALDKDE